MHLPEGNDMAKNRIVEFTLGLSSFLMLLSMSFFLLHWRVSNEPGAAPVPFLLFLYRSFLIAGVSGFILSLVRFFKDGEGSVLRLLAVIGIAVGVYLPLFGITILMMV